MERKDITRLITWFAWDALFFGVLFSLISLSDDTDSRQSSLLASLLAPVMIFGVFGHGGTMLDIHTRRAVQARNRPWIVKSGWLVHSLKASIVVQCDEATTVLDSVLGALEEAGLHDIETIPHPSGDGIDIIGSTRGATGSRKTQFHVGIEKSLRPRDWTVRIGALRSVRHGPGNSDGMRVIDHVLEHVSEMRPRKNSAPNEQLQSGWYRGEIEERDLVTNERLIAERVLRVQVPTFPGDARGIRVAAFDADGSPATTDEIVAAAGADRCSGYLVHERIEAPTWA